MENTKNIALNNTFSAAAILPADVFVKT